jgi:hypothetical protein
VEKAKVKHTARRVVNTTSAPVCHDHVSDVKKKSPALYFDLQIFLRYPVLILLL